MDIVTIICAKRDGRALTREQIEFFVTGLVSGDITDYQVTALLMAVYLKGMDLRETVDLTRAMTDSGAKIDLSAIAGPKIDKHSTGGVGDKTTLVALPIAVAAGVTVAKLSGRGLGHTGGTLDKLEAIPGLRTDLTPAELIEQAGRIGLAIAGQSTDIVPADKKLYALRDVTGTVGSVPLITASVMSKKIAGGADGIVLDVKCGSGAFMREIEGARGLARRLVDVGKELGARTVAIVSEMEQPLGCAVGNALEVAEAIEVLSGGGPVDVRELSIELAARMVALAGGGGMSSPAGAIAKRARTAVEEVLSSGAALGKFEEMIRAQGGDARVASDPQGILPAAAITREVAATSGGFVQAIDCRAVGRASGLLGAGRARVGDAVDPAAGIVVARKTGDAVDAGEPLAVLHTSDAGKTEEAACMIVDAVTIGDEPPERRPLILDVLDCSHE